MFAEKNHERFWTAVCISCIELMARDMYAVYFGLVTFVSAFGLLFVGKYYNICIYH